MTAENNQENLEASVIEKDQQRQAKKVFNESADAWQKQSQHSESYSLIEHRNSIVMNELLRYSTSARLLDVGCGTGQLVIEACGNNHVATGVDYAKEMIEHCLQNAASAGVNADFQLGSIFDLSFSENQFEVISALGFIEYLSQSELEEFFKLVGQLLTDSGRLVIGTRNRLFNVATLNQFTQIEIDLDTFDSLVQQALVFQDVSLQYQGFEFLAKFAEIQRQPKMHPETGGIRVDTRYQYSPGELYHRLDYAGYDIDQIYPVHYHSFPPGFKSDHPDEHARVAAYAQYHGAHDRRLIPWCSTLVISAHRKANA